MSFELIALLIIGAAFILFGIFVLFLPEVKERKGKYAVAKEEKDGKKRKGVFFWLFEPKRLPFTGSAIGVTVFVATAVILAAVPRTLPSSSIPNGSSSSSSDVSSGNVTSSTNSTETSASSTSMTSSETTSSIPSSQPTGSVFTEGELPTWDLTSPMLGLASDLGFNHTIDFVNYSPKIHEKDYMVWGYERYDNIPTSISDTFSQPGHAIRYSMLRIEIFNAYTGDLVFEFDFDPGETYRTAYLNDTSAQQIQEFLNVAYDGDRTILVNISPRFKTPGSFGAFYEKAGAYQPMLDYLNNTVSDEQHAFLLQFDLSNPTTYTVLDYFSTANNRSAVQYSDFLFKGDEFVMLGTGGSNVDVNYSFVSAYLDNNSTSLEANQSIMVTFSLTGTRATLTSFFAFANHLYVGVQTYKDGLINRLYDEQGRLNLQLGQNIGYGSTFDALETLIDEATVPEVDDAFFSELKQDVKAEVPAFQTLIEAQFPTTLPGMNVWMTFVGFIDIATISDNNIQLINPIYSVSLSHRDNSIGLFLARNLTSSRLNQPEGFSPMLIQSIYNEVQLTRPTTIEDYIKSAVNRETSYYTYNPQTGVKEELFTDLDPSIALSEIIVHENGYYGSGLIEQGDDLDAILLSFDTNQVETARFVPEGSRTDIGMGFVTSPLGDPVWSIMSFSTDGDYTPFAIDLPAGSSQTYWVQFNRAS